MATDVASTLAAWSTTESSNAPAGTVAISTNLDDNLRMIQAIVRTLASSASVASAGTTDIGGTASFFQTITGTTTITGLGTVSAGIWRVLVFAGALTLTHNAGSLILPGAASITTAAGDVAMMLSLGSGNWRCLFYSKASGAAVVSVSSFADGTVGAPGLYLVTDTNTGFYKIGADSLGLAVGGVKLVEFSTAEGLLVTGKSTLGPLQIAANDAVTLAMNSQDFTISGWGNINFAGTNSTGGDIILTGGQGGSEDGNILITAANASSGNAGYLALQGGVTTTGGNGGKVSVDSGYNLATGVGADIELTMNGATTAGDLSIGAHDATHLVHDSFYKFKGATRHLHVVQGTAGLGPTENVPSVTAGGGTGPSVTGTDNAFQITIGTGGSASTVTVTFKEAWSAAPMVIASHQGAVLALRCAATATTVTISASSAFTASGVIDVFCIGRE